MGQSKKNPFTRLNSYSWSILIIFICATLAMQYNTARVSFGDFFQTLPLIVIMIYWCEKLAPLIRESEYNLKKTKLFSRDLFILSYSFLLACLISLLFEYHNSDTKGWWPLIIYFITLYGFFFAVVFSLLVLLIENHKKYILGFSLLIIFLVSFGNFFPRYISLPFLENVDTFFITTCLLLAIHAVFAISYRIGRLFFHGSSSNNQTYAKKFIKKELKKK